MRGFFKSIPGPGRSFERFAFERFAFERFAFERFAFERFAFGLKRQVEGLVT